MTMLGHFVTAVAQAQPLEYWLTTGLGLVIGSAAGWAAFSFVNRRRVIEDLPTALIRSAAQGYVELQGHAELMDGDGIYAVLSTRVCVWYKYKVEKRERQSGNRNSGWSTIDQGTSDDLFYLVDATGRCAVDPDGATVTANHRNVWYGISRIPGSYQDSDGAWWARGLGRVGKPYRYTEHRIEPGDQIYTLGNFTTHGSAGTQFDKDGAVGDRLRIWKRDQAFMLQHFDANRDGQIDMQEWEAARAEAERLVAHEHEQGGQPPPVDVLGRTHDRRRPFVIHAGTEEELIRRCRNWSLALFGLSVPVLVLVAWSVALRFASG
jgi:hypothetical protein